MIDNVMVIDSGGLTSSLSFEDQQKLKAILLTHQHYDHIRDTAAIVFNFAMWNSGINIYSILPVYEIITTHFLNGIVYPKFLGWPPENPRSKFNVVESLETQQIEGYSVLPVAMKHSVPSVGYQITSPSGKKVFYTGDTGPDLAECWEQIAPQLLIIETSAPDRFEKFYKRRGHLTPNLLKQELASFREVKGYLPQVVVVHMNPGLEDEIKAEIDVVSEELNHPITLGYEGMKLHL
ncbi:MAG: MBL fold metallo-hydrolase [Dehalococcoidales bacterium]|nr:MBL fold metallo-hydrolase [Dehalococcoidales bacterium]